MFAFLEPPPFKPLLEAYAPRQPCISSCANHQSQSPFFADLPPEIRNNIYRYAFVTKPRELLCVDAHPLSLLLTCHKVYHEASVLAFSVHTFPLSYNMHLNLFVNMSAAISHLSSQHVQAITALSLDLRQKYPASGPTTDSAVFIANSILLLPSLKQFNIRVLRGKRNEFEIHDRSLDTIGHDQRKNAINKFAPRWFLGNVLRPATEGHAYAWQAGQYWKIEWPQLEADIYLDELEVVNCYGEPCFTPFMSPDAVGNVRGVHMCPCLCGRVEWTSADLVQETGRKVSIDTFYYGPEDRPLPILDREALLKARLGPTAVILKEGAAPLNVLEGPNYFASVGVTSLAYDADEEYWEGMRRKNGNWGAIWRGLWKGMTARSTEDKFPGSRSLGEGDWARLTETAEDVTFRGQH